VPAYLLAIAVASFAINVPGNQLSREVEESADRFALELTDDPRALIELQRRLAESNLADPDPPGLVTTLFGTHPPTVDRIGAALAYERERPN
jgi:STE24 endopeptidase